MTPFFLPFVSDSIASSELLQMRDEVFLFPDPFNPLLLAVDMYFPTPSSSFYNLLSLLSKSSMTLLGICCIVL